MMPQTSCTKFWWFILILWYLWTCVEGRAYEVSWEKAHPKWTAIWDPLFMVLGQRQRGLLIKNTGCCVTWSVLSPVSMQSSKLSGDMRGFSSISSYCNSGAKALWAVRGSPSTLQGTGTRTAADLWGLREPMRNLCSGLGIHSWAKNRTREMTGCYLRWVYVSLPPHRLANSGCRFNGILQKSPWYLAYLCVQCSS